MTEDRLCFLQIARSHHNPDSSHGWYQQWVRRNNSSVEHVRIDAAAFKTNAGKMRLSQITVDAGNGDLL